MKPLPSPAAFTLIEMLTVMAVIAILASILLSLNGLVQRKGALARARGEIAAMSAACESYKSDFGVYPEDSTDDPAVDPDTVKLCPLRDGDPTKPIYRDANVVLYKALSGDAKKGANPEPPATRTDKPDGRAETKPYYEFRPAQLRKSANGDIEGIQDPFGNLYGYSTTAGAYERFYQGRLQTNAAAKRLASGGYNPTFDLWSTGGVISQASNAALDPDRNRWEKNW